MAGAKADLWLFDILKLTNDWLKFAEAKNATLLAFSSIGAFSCARLLVTGSLSNTWFVAVEMAAMLAGVAAFIALVSFVPVKNLPNLVRTKGAKPSPDSNLFYYGHVRNFSSHDYADAVIEKLGLQRSDDPGEARRVLQVADQIVMNSRIAYKKYQFFDVGVWLVTLAMFCLAGGLIYGTVGS